MQRRWPSVEKAERLLGWEARIGLREGIAGTVEWLRERELARAARVTDARSGQPASSGARASSPAAAASPARHLLGLLADAVAPGRDELDLLDGGGRSRRAAGAPLPQTVFHLAALASVGRSWEEPGRDARRERGDDREPARGRAPRGAARRRVVLVELGRGLRAAGAAAGGRGRAPLRPQNPYAVSKAACDLLGGQYADAFGLRVVRLRPFNHAGPGQSDDYVIGTLTRQVAEAEAAGRARVRAAHRQPRLGRATSPTCATWCAPTCSAAELEPGAYNVASGRAVSVRELVELVRAGGARAGAPRGRPRPRARARRARGARLGRAPARGHRLGARDPARADGGRRARRVAGGGVTLAVVIVTYDSAEPIGATLAALEGQLEDDDELVVVDNGSADGTPRRGARGGAAGAGARAGRKRRLRGRLPRRAWRRRARR